MKIKDDEFLPDIIQGGMGIGVSNYRLANEVSRLGGLGTISLVAANVVVARLLQKGDINILRAFQRFPFRKVAIQVAEKYFVAGGLRQEEFFKKIPAFTLENKSDLIDLTICASFALVWLAKEGHNNLISVNLLDKVKMSQLYSLYGAVLAGADCVSMGAGTPFHIPKILGDIVAGNILEMEVPVDGGKNFKMIFDPKKHFEDCDCVYDFSTLKLERPSFLPIISSLALAKTFLRRCPGGVQGFIFENYKAGGHNAPPRNKIDYSGRDEINFDEFKKLDLPFWTGGGLASPESLAKVQASGATGIQVGSIFALCEESGVEAGIKKELRRLGFREELEIKTDFDISPTKFPFKKAMLSGSLTDDDVFQKRPPSCSIGGLLTPCLVDGEIVYRCLALDKNSGCKCLCNGLFATVGLGGLNEPPVITLGDNLDFLQHLMKNEDDSYTAKDVMNYLSPLRRT